MDSHEIYGQIGSAKIFTKNVGNLFQKSGQKKNDQIASLVAQVNSTTDNKEREALQKKIKRAEKNNERLEKAAQKAQNATDFLTKIASFCDTGKKEIINWLATFLVGVLPAVEESVKALLLTNLKTMLDCKFDPNIPDKLRTEGIVFTEEEIDPRGILKSSPYSKFGQSYYHDVVEILDDVKIDGKKKVVKVTYAKPINSLVRAIDMNAFLWFAKNHARFVQAQCINNNTNVGTQGKLKDFFDVKDGEILGQNDRLKEKKGGVKFLSGCTFKQCPSSNTIYIITDTDIDNNGTHYRMRPCSSSWSTVNYYKVKNNGVEVPLFSLEYATSVNSSADFPIGSFRFKILPKAFSNAGGFISETISNTQALTNTITEPVKDLIAGKEKTKEEAKEQLENTLAKIKAPNINSLLPVKARFTFDGKYDNKGFYSINEAKYNITLKACRGEYLSCYELTTKEAGDDKYYMYFNSKTKQYFFSYDDPDSPSFIGNPQENVTLEDISSIITQCYTKNTVYEFNYDYIYSFKLFNNQVIANSIVNSLLGIDIPNPLKRNKEENSYNSAQTYIDTYVDTIIQKFIETEDNEFSDCFYKFSNDEFVSLEEAISKKIATQTLEAGSMGLGDEVYDILNAYKADASLNEQIETYTQAFLKTADIIQESVDGGVYNTNTTGTKSDDDSNDFISLILKTLTSAIVNSLLTPKVLLLIKVNQSLMGGSVTTNTKNAFNSSPSEAIVGALNGFSSVISGVVKNVINLIQKELLRMILNQLKEMFNGYVRELSREYVDKWRSLLKQIFSCFLLNGSNNNTYSYNSNNAVENALNQLETSDIDIIVGEIVPDTKDC